MPIDPSVAIGAQLPSIEFSWTSSDVQLYHLGLGAGADPMNPRELSYLVDHTPQVLPTFGCVVATFHDTEPPKVSWPGVDIDLAKILHASEQVTVSGPLPPSGSARGTSRIVEVWDKGKAAVLVTETSVIATDGTPLWTQRRSIFARGEGGFGGERGPSSSVALHRTARAIMRCRCRSCPSRPCSTGCAVTATRCTPTRNSLPPRDFHGRFCTACARTELRARRSSTRASTATSTKCAPTVRGSRASHTPARCCWRGSGRRTTGIVATVTAPSRDDEPVLSGVELVQA